MEVRFREVQFYSVWCMQVVDVFCVYSCTCHKIFVDHDETNRYIYAYSGTFEQRTRSILGRLLSLASEVINVLAQ